MMGVPWEHWGFFICSFSTEHLSLCQTLQNWASCSRPWNWVLGFILHFHTYLYLFIFIHLKLFGSVWWQDSAGTQSSPGVTLSVYCGAPFSQSCSGSAASEPPKSLFGGPVLWNRFLQIKQSFSEKQEFFPASNLPKEWSRRRLPRSQSRILYKLEVTHQSEFIYFLIHTESENCSILMSYILLDGKASISRDW